MGAQMVLFPSEPKVPAGCGRPWDTTDFFDLLPDGVLQIIVGHLHRAKDIACVASVSKRMNQIARTAPSLYFLEKPTQRLGTPQSRAVFAEKAAMRMILSSTALRELAMSFPSSEVSLLAWLLHTRDTLEVLNVRMEGDVQPVGADNGKLYCIASMRMPCLRTLVLNNICLDGREFTLGESWSTLAHLKVLEITGAQLRDEAIDGLLALCPNVEDVSIMGMSGLESPTFRGTALRKLRVCSRRWSSRLRIHIDAPTLEELVLDEAAEVYMTDASQLQKLQIGTGHSGIVGPVVLGPLPKLTHLTCYGGHWNWQVVNDLLRASPAVEELTLKVDFTNNSGANGPFPSFQFETFFAGFPRLQKFTCRGAMLASFVHSSNSLAETVKRLHMPSLRHISVAIRSASNQEGKLQSLHSILACSPVLKTLDVRLELIPLNITSLEREDELYRALLRLQRKYPRTMRIL